MAANTHPIRVPRRIAGGPVSNLFFQRQLLHHWSVIVAGTDINSARNLGAWLVSDSGAAGAKMGPGGPNLADLCVPGPSLVRHKGNKYTSVPSQPVWSPHFTFFAPLHIHSFTRESPTIVTL